MSPSNINIPTESVTLTLENSLKEPIGFFKKLVSVERNKQYSKALASALLKYTEPGQQLSGLDSPQSFIDLAGLHQELTDQSQQFLQEEVPFVYEDQPIQSLLLNFALFRLKQVSRKYYFASLQNQPKAVLDDLKLVIQQHQQTYDTILQQV